MLNTDCEIAIPNWQSTATTRLGKYMRRYPDRFFYLKRYGWFVYVRAQRFELPGIIAHDGVLGPYRDKGSALYGLQQYLFGVYRGGAQGV